MATYFTSDWHFGHDREFIWKSRGFNSVDDMNFTILKNHNHIVTKNDDVYILGDCMLGNNEEGKKLIAQMNGKLHIILGNHDTAARKNIYNNLHNVVEVSYADQIKVDGWYIYLSHYPTITCNLEKEFSKKCILNFYGHTHQLSNFYNGLPFCYHVGVDSHECKPVRFEDAIKDIENEVKNCKFYL